MMKDTRLKQLFLLFIMCCGAIHAQGSQKFKVILDAGHGGKDFGAVYNGYVEKNITLNVVLKAGKILEGDNGIDVIYTRKADVFTELTERPGLANRNSGDIFISVHCNSENTKAAFGAETYVIGTTKNASNIDVAKKENVVMSVEKDYKVKYEGYNTAAPEVIAGALSTQEPVLSKSIDLASKVQEGFVNNAKRKNRGVKQAPLWVLNKAAMPGIFIVLGFISNADEGAYLNSDAGQDEMAKALAAAILAYKKEYFTVSGAASSAATLPAKPVAAATTTTTAAANVNTPVAASTAPVVFKVQIAASGTDIALEPYNFNGLSPISKDASTAVIKYFYGGVSSYAEAKELLVTAKEKGYTSAYVVAFRDGKKIPLQDALK
ncbi:N-acetylmuramoyl-L-alanine amidase family protein [Flavobacterium sp. RHBU_24]|uniref:N-acetylmuramoyl-L-alanine amidase family protein n=1 Tax=Flavobacterium sp. RHBU_24 TaxID=3391185 RepID=UPI003984EDB4